MIISRVNQDNLSQAMDLLKNSGLPTEDISNKSNLFIAEEDGNVVGTIGLEYEGDVGLLRSLCIDEQLRNRGYGPKLVGYLERYCEQNGVKKIYLLTTSAEKFFQRRGFYVARREDLPSFIRNSSEFTSVCPSSALVMMKELE